ncbi:MAG: Cyanophycinase [Candidatus Heimdallarchaeota archaeon LC_2]|nr:MAG: Cyanophycinase [Candidatus Heimdallarchaeota archaeon LC_2]
MDDSAFPLQSSKFLAIGGGMELSSTNPLIQKFIELAGGRKAKITVLPTASDFGHEIGPMYTEAFSELCDDVQYFLIDDRSDTDDIVCLKRLKESTGIFFTGGNQLRITSILGGSKFLEIIKARLEKGIIIAGTSAGATAMSTTMITWGRADEMVKGNLQLSPGIGFISNMVIDSHFIKRGRISRLLHLVALNPGSLGIGLAENSGILVSGDESYPILEVIGSRQVIVVDGRSIVHSNIANVKENRPYTVTNVLVHALGPNYKYNFRDHEIIAPISIESTYEIEEPAMVSEMPFKRIVRRE